MGEDGGCDTQVWRVEGEDACDEGEEEGCGGGWLGVRGGGGVGGCGLWGGGGGDGRVVDDGEEGLSCYDAAH